MLCLLSYTGERLPRQGDAGSLPGYRFLAAPGNGHRRNRASLAPRVLGRRKPAWKGPVRPDSDT